jgi:hypothetical protein
MTTLVFFIEQTSLGLYFLTGLGIYITWRRYRRIGRDLRATHFELEREIFRYRRTNALTLLILLIEFGLIVVGIQYVVAPAIRQASSNTVVASDLVTDLPFYTPTPAPVQFGNSPIDASGVQLGEEEINQVQATPTLTPTPVGTIVQNPPPISGCDEQEATLQVPANGMVVFEATNVIGTAFTENFAFYRFELSGPATGGSFAPLGEYTQPVMELGALGQFVPTFYEPGDYQFRLTIFDITQTLAAACTVNIVISEPIPTPTPLQP